MRGHGRVGTPEHRAWQSMLQRVRGTASSGHEYYLGRGIKCCERWYAFENFYADMGDRPSPSHSLDRLDNNGDYCPENCAWRTIAEQNRNKSSNVKLTHDARTMTVAEWGREVGMSSETIYYRLKVGWTVSRALTAPRTKGKLSKEKYNEYRADSRI